MNQPMMGEHRILIASGPDKGRAFRILPPQVRLGRDLDNDIVLTDPRISRNHLVLEFIEGRLKVRDISKRPGLKVNSKPTKEVGLNNGDQILLGSTKMLVQVVQMNQGAALQVAQSGQAMAHAQQGSSGLGPSAYQNYGQPGPNPNMQAAKQGGSKKPLIYIVVGAILLFLFLGDSDTKKKKVDDYDITTSEEMDELIEETQKRNQEMREKRSFASVEEKIRYETAQAHFIIGRRDYTKGKFDRAIEAFQTALASDRNHEDARRYYYLAKKRRDEVIDSHLREGQYYANNSHYDKCAASLLKAMVMINNPQEEKYKQAKIKREQCQLQMENR